MRSLTVLLLLAATPPARAESAPPYLPPIEPEEQLDTARVQRTAGAVLTVMGAAIAVSAIGMAGYATHAGGVPIDCGPDAACQHQQPLFFASVGLAVVATALAATGIPSWVTGSDKVKKLEKHVHVSGFFSKSGGGAALRVSF